MCPARTCSELTRGRGEIESARFRHGPVSQPRMLPSVLMRFASVTFRPICSRASCKKRQEIQAVCAYRSTLSLGKYVAIACSSRCIPGVRWSSGVHGVPMYMPFALA